MFKLLKRNGSSIIKNKFTIQHLKNFTKIKTKNIEREEDKYVYIMRDKYSVEPDKEIKIIKKEIQNDSHVKYEYTTEMKNKQNLFKSIFSFNFSGVKQLVRKGFGKVFLPRDYPNSVKEGYYHFSKYGVLCGVLFHIMNFLSTQALINSLGILSNRTVSFSLSAGMNWVLKDGIGQIGSIFFAAKFSTPIERDLKKWRIISLWMYNISMIIDCFTLLQPHYFIYYASFATLCK